MVTPAGDEIYVCESVTPDPSTDLGGGGESPGMVHARSLQQWDGGVGFLSRNCCVVNFIGAGSWRCTDSQT